MQATLMIILGVHLLSVLFGLISGNWTQVGISGNTALILTLYLKVLYVEERASS